MMNNHGRKMIVALSVGIVSAIATSCTSTSNNNTVPPQDTLSEAQKMAYNQAKSVFYALPSPMETAATLEKFGIKFSDENLHKTSDIDKYNTTSSQAINLGIYSADLCFCALYEQNQKVVDYLTSVKKLSEQLGIVGFFNDSTVVTLQKNINNKNKMVSEISEAYSRSTSYLDEQERSEIASTVIVGGWVETLHLSLKMLLEVDIEKNIAEVNDIIINQEYTLEDLIGMLSLFENDNYIVAMATKLKDLKTVFDKVQTDIDKKQKNITKEHLNELSKFVTDLRNDFIQ